MREDKVNIDTEEKDLNNTSSFFFFFFSSFSANQDDEREKRDKKGEHFASFLLGSFQREMRRQILLSFILSSETTESLFFFSLSSSLFRLDLLVSINSLSCVVCSSASTIACFDPFNATGIGLATVSGYNVCQVRLSFLSLNKCSFIVGIE